MLIRGGILLFLVCTSAAAAVAQEIQEQPPVAVDGAVQDTVTLVSQAVKTLAFLGGLCVAGVIAVKLLGPRLSPLNAKPGDLIKVVDAKRLDGRTTLYVIEVGGRHALISVCDGQVRALSQVELDDELIREQAAARKNTFAQVLKR